ncbi:TauD/TfdA dioxygenase family protein [Janthinobacterium sp. GB4P2]|uniref:TauD/TfdA dioxygenase family protein n=1 Tax=Janthinobacterium sp. GB4P2 TaxID=3424189 RepID=UPI003F22187F
MNLVPQRLDGSGGVLISRCNGESLLDLPTESVKSLMRSAGVVMFRGFDAGPEMMKQFADQYSYKFNRDRLRPTVEGSGGHVQMVTEGMGYVDPHCEQANSPFRPDALWFTCTKPAAEGGETLYWDGIRLWAALSDELKDVFRQKKLRFFQRYSKEKWQLFLGYDATVADIKKELDGVEGVSYFLNADEALYLEYVSSAVVQTRYGHVEAFANSLMSEWKNTLGDLMTFDDGSLITEDIVQEVKTALDSCTEAVDWQPGDLVFIDNSRFLHGRNGFTDTTRKIYSSLSFLNF